jgi:uncharacterized circularly permuted ATP-grasp superfamily protein
LKQRVRALNTFFNDIYHRQEILQAKVIPAEHVLCHAQHRVEKQGIGVPGDIYVHIAGIDVVRTGRGELDVLEANLRVPSGGSYRIEDRRMMMAAVSRAVRTSLHRTNRALSGLIARELARRSQAACRSISFASVAMPCVFTAT